MLDQNNNEVLYFARHIENLFFKCSYPTLERIRKFLSGVAVHKYCTDFVRTRRREAWWPNCMSGEGARDREGFIVSESDVTARGKGVAKNNVRPGQMPLYVMVLEAEDN